MAPSSLCTLLKDAKAQVDLRTIALLGLAVVITPFDISQLVCLVLGAAGYMFVQSMRPTISRKPGKVATQVGNFHGAAAVPTKMPAASQGMLRRQQRPDKAELDCKPKAPVWTPSVVPVAAPTFQALGWEGEVEELATRLAASAESDLAVAQVVRAVQRSLAVMLPEATATGFASGSLKSGAAFGVAVPELELVITADPSVMHRQFKAALDAQKLHKAMLRAVTDRLVSKYGFKFRRSAFRSEAPTVTLLAPAGHPGTGDEAVPLSLSVNNVTPIRATALLAESGQREPKAKALILLVRRWAKDRGLSHVAAGHLPPYVWTLLTMYFLQVGVEAGALLPALTEFTAYAKLIGSEAAGSLPASTTASSNVSLGELLKAFFQFFADFDWHHEAICPRTGRRAAPSPKLPLNILMPSGGGATEVGPSIEDPFDGMQNCGKAMTMESFARLRDELRRAHQLCMGGSSLATLLEPWAPADAEKAEKAEE